MNAGVAKALFWGSTRVAALVGGTWVGVKYPASMPVALALISYGAGGMVADKFAVHDKIQSLSTGQPSGAKA